MSNFKYLAGVTEVFINTFVAFFWLQFSVVVVVVVVRCVYHCEPAVFVSPRRRRQSVVCKCVDLFLKVKSALSIFY